MKKITKTFNDTNSSNLTACTEDNNQSNGDSILENTNDILFTPVHEFILNKTIVKKSKNVNKKKSSNRTFYIKPKAFNEEWEDINMEKWYQNRIKISKDLKNEKRNIYRLFSDNKIKSRAHQLTAEKGKGIYTIRNDVDIIGKIKWNIFSNHFKVFDDKDNLIEEIIYSFNFKGWNGPTKLQIKLPKASNNVKSWNKTKNKKLLHHIENKPPEYNDFFNVYTLKFIRRKVIPNEKNLQLIFSEYKEDKNNILLQFAQSKENEFILDYKYPFNNITAFAVAITSLSSRTFCK